MRYIITKYQDLILRPGFKKYLYNTGWMFSEKGLRLIAGLFVGAYVARYLGPSKYGLLNYVLSLVSLFSVISTIGLESIIIRELVHNEQKKNILLGTAFILRLVGVVVMYILLIAFVKSTSTDRMTSNIIYIIASGAFFEIFGIIDYFFQSKVLSKYVVWSQMIALVIISILRIIMVLNNASLIWFAWAYSIDFLIISIGLLIFYNKNSKDLIQWRFDITVAKQLLKNSWPLIFSSLAITIYMKIDQIMIKWMLNDSSNGIYGVAVRLSEMWNFIPMAICASVFPAILNAKLTDENLYIKRMKNLFSLMVLMAAALAIPMTFLSEYIVTILFGEEYRAAGNILSLYVWSGIFTFLGVANGKWIISENLQIFRMKILIAAGVINVILNYTLIPRIGLIGATVATLVAYSFSGYFSFALTRKTRPMFWRMTHALNPLNLFNHFTKDSSL